MPTFTPPAVDDVSVGDPNDDSWKLFKWMGLRKAGQTIWKDENDLWHSTLYPYQGGEITRTYDDTADPKYVETAPSPGLATAKEVFLGGHVYTVSSAMAGELSAAGFGSGLNTQDIDLIWTEEDIAKLNRRVASTSANLPLTPTIDGQERIVFGLDSPFPGHSGDRRDYWMVDGTGSWEDIYFETILRPDFFGDLGGYFALPQSGVCLRRKFQSGKWRAITINNNIFLGLSMLNIGVWEMNEDGTGFANRQFGWDLFESYPLPYGFKGYLAGNIVTIGIHRLGEQVSWNDPTKAKVLNLDTDCGDAVLIPTPTGPGDSEFSAGIVAAHSSGNPEGYCKQGRTLLRRTK